MRGCSGMRQSSSTSRFSTLSRNDAPAADIASSILASPIRLGTQQEIIRDIEHHNVRAAIIWKFGWPDTVLDQYRSGFKAATDDGGATLLNEYIAERFEPIAQYDEYVLMWRKDAMKAVLTTP